MSWTMSDGYKHILHELSDNKHIWVQEKVQVHKILVYKVSCQWTTKMEEEEQLTEE